MRITNILCSILIAYKCDCEASKNHTQLEKLQYTSLKDAQRGEITCSSCKRIFKYIITNEEAIIVRTT